MMIGRPEKIEEFGNWLRDSPFSTIVIIAGNQDILSQKKPEKARRLLSKHDKIHYLEDSACRVGCIPFYGTSWQREFSYGWAFTLNAEEELKKKWHSIVSDVQVLITHHGRPYGILDFTVDVKHAVNTSVLAEIRQRIKPTTASLWSYTQRSRHLWNRRNDICQWIDMQSQLFA